MHEGHITDRALTDARMKSFGHEIEYTFTLFFDSFKERDYGICLKCIERNYLKSKLKIALAILLIQVILTGLIPWLLLFFVIHQAAPGLSRSDSALYSFAAIAMLNLAAFPVILYKAGIFKKLHNGEEEKNGYEAIVSAMKRECSRNNTRLFTPEEFRKMVGERGSE
jgi:hypothetical protein